MIGSNFLACCVVGHNEFQMVLVGRCSDVNKKDICMVMCEIRLAEKRL